MRRTGPFLLALTLSVFLAATSKAQSTHTHHVRDAVRNGEAQQNGQLPANQVLSLDLVLPLRDPAGLDAFVADVYNPKSANYRHFLTPTQFTERFGPSQADYDAAAGFARSNGLTVTGGSRDGMDIQVKGSVSAIESAFRIKLNTYKHPNENRTFFSTDREPTTNLAFNLWHISGLDNYSIPHPLLVNRNDYAAAHNISPDGIVSHATSGSGPSASFLGSDMRAAYYGNGSLSGSGQTVGLLEYYGTDLADLNTYYANAKQTNNVPVVLFSVDGTPTSCLKSAGCDDTEQELDITQALGMAPGLSELTMYVGMSDTAIISAMTTHSPLPLTIGCSWGWTPVDPTYLDPYFRKMASQGQSFFAASGDSSTWSSRVQAWPADDPNVISVGGSDLITASANGPWQSETAWVDSGGGITTNGFAIPAWQQIAGVISSANGGSTTLRNGPDVSANANFTFYTCSNQTSCLANSYGGTSFAAPMWAGYVALANQQLATNSQPPVGFLNPAIYQQNADAPTYAANFHDITGGTSGSYSAVAGYDLVTGWGSPNAGLMAALTGSTGSTPQSNPDFGISASASSLSATVSSTQGAMTSSTITTTVSGGFNSNLTLSASNSTPTSGITVQFATNPIAGGAGSSVATFSVPAGTGAGTYGFTITASGGGVIHTTSVSLTVSATAPPAPAADFTLAATAPPSLRRSGTTSSTVTTAGVNGFNSNVSLSASAGSGLTVSFNPPAIASGSGSSTMTITAAKNAGFGTHSITVTASSGSIRHTTTVNVTVTK
ncbi:MAG TPA: protease pro-enzyme activation domain-containing protein [Acidobacteriaceae bacterium]|jgi:kumamolisin|nr:protease pro-enzyme activation domain-containing protein [Acidobacteriaceae bacterium]